MHEYYCKKCRLLFENSINQSRCPTFKCQSRQIKYINVSFKGPEYRNLEWCMEDEGEKARRLIDKQGRWSRQQIQKLIEEEMQDG
jgi:hypothetical protein